jgi:MFS family permease
LSAALRRSFGSLEIPNYRRYFAGQIVSLSGNWMQMVAEMWLILTLTNSGVAVGVTSALQFLPILLFGAWGGVIADRFSKRRLLIVTQTLMAAPALALFALTASGVVAPWMVFALVFVRGAVNAVDNPTRQCFVIEMVGSDRLVNAVSLNSVLVHCARILGPAGAGILIATLGIAPCFLLNAATFAVMIFALRGMDPARLSEPTAPERGSEGVRAAIAYVRREPGLLIPLAMMVVVGMLAFNFQVLLPLLARFTFDGGATTYTALAIAMAVGSICGALTTGARGRVSERLLTGAAIAFGISALVAAVAPTLPLEMLALAPLGFASVTFAAGINSTLQLGAAPAMRGRVMALYSVVFLGSTPIGAPIAGWLAEVGGPRAGLILGGVAAIAAGVGGWIAFSRARDPEWALADLGWGWRGRLWGRRATAIETGSADQLQRLEGRRGLNVEADAVARLDRLDGGLAPTPHERDRDRVAGADDRDLRPEQAGDSDREREGSDRPKAHECDPPRALGRKAGRHSRTGEHATDRVRRLRRAPEPRAGERGNDPPRRRDLERELVDVAVGDDDADGRKRRGDPGDEQDRDPQEVVELHQRRLRNSSAISSGELTTTSASR